MRAVYRTPSFTIRLDQEAVLYRIGKLCLEVQTIVHDANLAIEAEVL